MAPPKGVVPPQLRPYLFRGRKRGARGGGSRAPRRSRARSWGRRAYERVRRVGRAEHFGGRTLTELKHSWVEMGLAALVGYELPATLAKLGVGQLAYNMLPAEAQNFLNAYVFNPNGGVTQNASTLVQWGGKVYGTVDAAKEVLSASKRGGFSRGSLVKTAFDLGLIFDTPIVQPSGGGGGYYW